MQEKLKDRASENTQSFMSEWDRGQLPERKINLLFHSTPGREEDFHNPKVRSSIQEAAVPIQQNTHLRILYRLQFIPGRHPKETRQLIPHILPTYRMPQLTVRHTLPTDMKLMPPCILPKRVQRVFSFQRVPLRIRASCIRAQPRPTPRGTTKIE